MEHASKQRVGLVPARYLDHPDVGVLELGVLTVLSIHADRTGLSWPSQTTIATKLKINRSTAANCPTFPKRGSGPRPICGP